MGKGKKKDKKKQEEPPPLSGLSIDSPTPSEPPSVPEVGLTGGPKEKPKGDVKPESSQSVAAPSTSVEKPKETVEAADEDEGGLGLGGGRKKPRNKKKKAEATPAPSPAPAAAPATAPASAYPTTVPTPSSQESKPLVTPQPTQAPSTWANRPQKIFNEPPKPSASQPSATPARVGTAHVVSGQGGPSGEQPARRPSGPAQPSKATPEKTRPATARPSYTEGAICRFKIPPRKDGNSVKVSRVNLLTNYLQMNINPKLKIFRYDVSFKPEVKKLIPKAYAAAKNRHFKNNLMAFDQMKNCYTTGALPGVPEFERFSTMVTIQDNNGRSLDFEVSFKFTGIVQLDKITQYMVTGGTSLNPPMEAIQCIDVILRQGTLMNYVKAGRQFFKRPSRPINLGGGLEMWTGLFQSAIFTSRAFVNIDVAHKGFPKHQPLLQTMIQDFELDPTKPMDRQAPNKRYNVEQFEAFVKQLRVIATVGGKEGGEKREFISNGLIRPATVETFPYTDPDTKRSEMMTVADFFTTKKGFRLKYPYLNCIWVGPKNKTIYYPLELVDVAYGQALNRQLNEKQLRTMVMEAATPPDDRKRKIEEVIRDMNYKNNADFKKFGLDISDKFHEVEAKILMPPRLDVGQGGTAVPRRGEWRANGVLKPEAMMSWGVVAIDVMPNSCDFGSIINNMMKTAADMGMQTARPALEKFNASTRDVHSIFSTAAQKGIKFLFVVVGMRAKDLYHRVKQLAEREVGILTQCIKEQTASRRMNRQTIQNILLKVNSKLMGVNQALNRSSIPRCLLAGDVMVVGADVTHPSPDQMHIPSIAAVTASLDAECYTYNIELSVQTPKKEMIVQFEDMMVDHLQVYKQRQGRLPKKIFVFRDGVSEGQFAQVMNSELQAVHNAYHTMTGNPNMKPEVLFLLVQKRHHTRLFLKNSPYNVEPGTVVDKDIVHASELDFYLVSHQAIKGTARPTRYHAVCNDGDLRHDEVEELTYYLCHLFSRCMRSVSYPTPTYYAHLACQRARSLTYGERFSNDELEKQPKRLRVMENILQSSRMFFV